MAEGQSVSGVTVMAPGRISCLLIIASYTHDHHRVRACVCVPKDTHAQMQGRSSVNPADGCDVEKIPVDEQWGKPAGPLEQTTVFVTFSRLSEISPSLFLTLNRRKSVSLSRHTPSARLKETFTFESWTFKIRLV